MSWSKRGRDELPRIVGIWFVVGWAFGLVVTVDPLGGTWAAWLCALGGGLFGFGLARRRELRRRGKGGKR